MYKFYNFFFFKLSVTKKKLAKQKINNPDATSVGYRAQCFALYVLIRWLQPALIPFVTTQSVAVDGGY